MVLFYALRFLEESLHRFINLVVTIHTVSFCRTFGVLDRNSMIIIFLPVFFCMYNSFDRNEYYKKHHFQRAIKQKSAPQITAGALFTYKSIGYFFCFGDGALARNSRPSTGMTDTALYEATVKAEVRFSAGLVRRICLST